MRIFAFLCLALCQASFGSVVTGRIDASVNNIPASYSTAAGSRILNGVGPTKADGYLVYNGSAVEIAGTCVRAGTVPADSNVQFYVPATASIGLDGAKLRDISYCYVRSMGAPIAAGVVFIVLKGE